MSGLKAIWESFPEEEVFEHLQCATRKGKAIQVMVLAVWEFIIQAGWLVGVCSAGGSECALETHGLGSNPSLATSYCVALRKLSDLSVPQLPHLRNGAGDGICLTGRW